MNLLRVGYNWLTAALRTQLLLTIAVLPLLACWQLPYSALTLIGNLVFVPFLIVFLAASSLLFFATLLGLPTGLLAMIVNGIAHYWHTSMSVVPRTYWLAITPLHGISALVIAILYWHWWPEQPSVRRGIVVILALINVSAFFMPPPGHSRLVRDQYSLDFKTDADGTLTLQDHGYISRAANTDALVDYEIMPHIIATYGHPARIKIGAPRNGKRLKYAAKLLSSSLVTAHRTSLFLDKKEPATQYLSPGNVPQKH